MKLIPRRSVGALIAAALGMFLMTVGVAQKPVAAQGAAGASGPKMEDAFKTIGAKVYDLSETGTQFPADVAALVSAFHAEHRRSYGQADEREPVELVNFRVTGVGLVTKARLRPRAGAAGPGAPAPKGERAAYFGAGAGWVRSPVFERDGLGIGAELSGPALVEEPGATVVVYPGHRARADAFGNLHVAVPR